MFKSSQNLFSNISCPSIKLNKPCILPNCIFSHETENYSLENPKHQLSLEINHTDDDLLTDTHKKIKFDKDKPPKFDSEDKLLKLDKNENNPASGENVRTGISCTSASASTNKIQQPVTRSGQQVDISRSSHPPPPPTDRRKDAEHLTPRPITKNSPAPLPQRLSYLKTIHKTIIDTGGHPTPKKLAIFLEHKTAGDSTTVSYPVNIRTLVKNIKLGKYKPENIAKSRRTKSESDISTYRHELENLIIPIDLLEARHYVTKTVIPALEELFDITNLRTLCDRCSTQFSVSNKQPTSCTFHLLRRPYDAAKGKRSDIFPCCSQPLGETNGCVTNQYHVFKLNDPQQLAAIIPYAQVPKNNGPPNIPLFAAAIDCEMGYTSFGMELIRLTVVDWDTGKTVLDRTVYPYGEIIDLNTRFSGVKSLADGIKVENGDGRPIIHETVTFKKARELLFQCIDSSTILVGHGLENDLQALRLIHTRVVDTAIRYPELKPNRTHSLKELTFKYLGRTIQLGEHDSSEDAIASMDIVKENIRRSLKNGR